MPDSSAPILHAHKLWLRRGERELFSGLSLALKAGEVVWLRAPNGRGKTTLLRILAGLITPEQGQIHWRGQTFSERFEGDRQAISFLDDKLGLARELTVEQNLRHVAGLSSHTDYSAVCQKLHLQHLIARPLGQLSTGQKKRCGMARLVLESAHVWLLDEPANGLDQDNRKLLSQLIEEHLAAGGGCIYASHDALPLQQSPRELWLGAV